MSYRYHLSKSDTVRHHSRIYSTTTVLYSTKKEDPPQARVHTYVFCIAVD